MRYRHAKQTADAEVQATELDMEVKILKWLPYYSPFEHEVDTGVQMDCLCAGPTEETLLALFDSTQESVTRGGQEHAHDDRAGQVNPNLTVGYTEFLHPQPGMHPNA